MKLKFKNEAEAEKRYNKYLSVARVIMIILFIILIIIQFI